MSAPPLPAGLAAQLAKRAEETRCPRHKNRGDCIAADCQWDVQNNTCFEPEGVLRPSEMIDPMAALADPTMVACKSISACQRFSHLDIVDELKRRGLRNGEEYKYVMVHVSDFEGYPPSGVSTYDRIGGSDPSGNALGQRYLKPGDGKKGGVKYFQVHDPIKETAAAKETTGEYYRVKADYNNKNTKPELVKILLASNKQIAKNAAARAKMTARATTKFAKGKFPSETTNPAMYDPRTGLLKPQHLTIDHHGLSAYDFKGDRHRVEWIPFDGPGNYSGSAKWTRYDIGKPLITTGMILKGIWDLDNRGLPKISQLNYKLHLGKFHQDKNGKWFEVQCIRKNTRNKSQSPANCKRNKDGTIKIKWGKPDPTLYMPDEVEIKGPKQFVTPLGIFTYDQLMKMPLDNILKMMIVLELMDESPEYAKKMSALGVGPFAPEKLAAALPGRQAGKMAVKGTPKTTTTLSRMSQANEDRRFVQAGLPKCEFPNPPFRCYTDSFIPGTCVPDESMCFKAGLRKPWREFMSNKDNFQGSAAKQAEFYDWAADASQDASSIITEKDIQEMLREQVPPTVTSAQVQALRAKQIN